jgi:hypothetical protein
MNILRSPTRNPHAAPRLDLALVSWAAVVAIALLAFLVHVLNEQVERSETLRPQLRPGGALPRSAGAAGPAPTPDAVRARRAEGHEHSRAQNGG